MTVDHAETEAARAGAGQLTPVAEPQPASSLNPPPPSSASRPAADAGPRERSADLPRILKIRLPVIVQLARRTLPIARIRRFSLGMIIEFDRPVGEPLTLLVNNRPIAEGWAVKVGENFGLRITSILDKLQRIRSFGS